MLDPRLLTYVVGSLRSACGIDETSRPPFERQFVMR